MKRLTLAFSLVLLLTLLTACGGSKPAPAAPAGEKVSQTGAPESPADSSLAEVKKRGKLQVGMSGQYPPFAYREADGKLIGFDVEITTEVAKRLGVEVEFVTMPFKGLMAALDTSRFDLIANQMSITDERKQTYAFSTPYVVSYSQLLVHKDNKAINETADIKGKTFAASQGSNYEQFLKDAGAKVEYYTSNATIFSDIAAGRIDGTMNDRLQVSYLVKTSGLPLRGTGEPDKKNDVALMLRKEGSSTLLTAINKALADMKADGTYLKISQAWFGEDVSK